MGLWAHVSILCSQWCLRVASQTLDAQAWEQPPTQTLAAAADVHAPGPN
jgi:hypothetical protein